MQYTISIQTTIITTPTSNIKQSLNQIIFLKETLYSILIRPKQIKLFANKGVLEIVYFNIYNKFIGR